MSEREKRFLEEEVKRGRTVPGELASKLAELGDEDISAAIDGLISSSGSFPAAPQERLGYDRQAEVELKETFNNIVLQFLEPVGFSIHTLADCVARVGDSPEKAEVIKGNVDACIGALKPLINAADAIKYHDIYDVLKAIERPLLEVQQGKRKTLVERDTKNLTRDFNELTRLIHQSLGHEKRPLLQQQMGDVKERYRTASNYLITEMLPFFKGVDPIDIQKIHAAGITRLNDLVIATSQEISEASSISIKAAEQVKLCTLRALMNTPSNTTAEMTSPPALATPPPPVILSPLVSQAAPKSDPTTTPGTAPSVNVHLGPSVNLQSLSSGPSSIEMDGPPTLSELTVEDVAAALNNPPPIFFPEPTPPPGERERLMNTLGVLQQDMTNYSQAATNLNVELERTYRALLRLRVERERLRGELEFHRDELKQFFEHSSTNDEEGQEVLAVHKAMFQSLRQVTDIVLVAMKKTDFIYGQMEDSVRDVRDLEVEVSDLRRKRRMARGSRGRSHNPDEVS